MSETIAHFQSTNGALITLLADAVTSSPHFTPSEVTRRREAAINLTMAFLPTEPVQTMLATQAAGHHMCVLDGFRDIGRMPLNSSLAVRARMVNVAQTKAVMQLMRECRIVRKEALAVAEAELAARLEARPAETVKAAPPPRPAPAQTPAAVAAPADAPGDAPGDAELQSHADDARLLAMAADFQAAYANTLETLAEACAANPAGAESVRPGLAASIPAALAELGRLPGASAPEQPAAAPTSPAGRR